jgi:hypothetical protein
LAPGRWRISPSSKDIQRCQKDAADDDTSRCIGGMIGAQNTSDDLCMEGHAGPMCMLCVVNGSQQKAYFDETQSRCDSCPTDTLGRAGALSGVLVGIFVLLFLLRFISRHHLVRIWCRTDQPKTRVGRVTMFFRKLFFYMTVFIQVFQHAAVPVPDR